MNKPLSQIFDFDLFYSPMQGAVRVEPGTVLWDRQIAVPVISVKMVNLKKVADRK